MGFWEITVILLMLTFNGVFAGYEMSLASLSLGRIKDLAEQGRPGARAALAMKSKMEASLAVVQIGITLVGAIAAATGGAGAEEVISPWLKGRLHVSSQAADFLAITAVVIPLSAVTITLGELVPKTIAIKNSERVCLLLSPVMKYFSYVMYPTVVLFEWLTKLFVSVFENGLPRSHLQKGDIGLIELRAQARALRTERIIGPEQEKIIIGASNFTKTSVIDIVIPAEDIVTLWVDGELPDHFITVHLEPYTRFPVVELQGDPQTIIGYVNIKELLFLAKAHPGNPFLREILRPMLTFSPEINLGRAFSVMMKEHVHLALVRDRTGLVRGMITLEDILEEVVGDIQDEFDRLPRHLTQLGRQWIVGGGVQVRALLSKIGREDLLAEDNMGLTFSDWVIREHGKKPKGGDVARVHDLDILVRKVRHSHIHEAVITDRR